MGLSWTGRKPFIYAGSSIQNTIGCTTLAWLWSNQKIFTMSVQQGDPKRRTSMVRLNLFFYKTNFNTLPNVFIFSCPINQFFQARLWRRKNKNKNHDRIFSSYKYVLFNKIKKSSIWPSSLTSVQSLIWCWGPLHCPIIGKVIEYSAK